jgi:hypothetical protein
MTYQFEKEQHYNNPNSRKALDEIMDKVHAKIEDDLLDLVNFAGFRFVMNEDRRDLI